MRVILLMTLVAILGTVMIQVAVQGPESKVLPYGSGGLPMPFVTHLVDDNGDGEPNRVVNFAIGPTQTVLGTEGKPTPEQIQWYKSQT